MQRMIHHSGLLAADALCNSEADTDQQGRARREISGRALLLASLALNALALLILSLTLELSMRS
jgi:hypothetical protein